MYPDPIIPICLGYISSSKKPSEVIPSSLPLIYGISALLPVAII